MSTSPNIIFEDFLRELKRAGFFVSLHDSIEFTAVWDKFGGSDVAGFKYYLAPIVCRNKEEQERFYGIYDRFYLSPPAPVRRRMTQQPAYYKEPWSVRKLFRNFLFWVCFLLLTGGGIKLTMLFLHRHKEPVVTVAKPDSVEFSPGDAVTESHGPVFVAKTLKTRSDSGELKSKVIPSGQPIGKQNAVHSTAFAWLVVLGLACLGVSTSFFPQRKSKFLPEVDLDTRRGDDAPVDLPFRPKDHLIQKQPVLTRLSVALALPVPTGAFRLDIKKTIHSCVSNYGLLLPAYTDIERAPEYLVLIDRKNTLHCHLFRWLTQTLIGDAVNMNYYFFDDMMGFFSEGSDKAVSFYGLRERHYPARLIIISDGYSFMDGDGGLFGDIEAELAQWDNKVMLTPVSSSDWEDHEYILSENIRMVSADMENCIHLAKYLSQEVEDGGAQLPVHQDGYESKYLHLEDMDVLREYLGDDDLFQWVCAIAVYPTIKWEVILSVGAAVLTASNALHKLNYTNLLKIVRIGWLNGKTIPQDIRVRLLGGLYIHSEIVARGKLLELLKESDELISADSDAYKEMLLLSYMQSFVLYASDTRKNKQHEQDAKKFLAIWDKQAVPDLATVIYLKNQDKDWDTPVRSLDNAAKSVGPNKFLNELLAMRVISDPKIRSYFRNAGVSSFAVLCLLFLFKDIIQGWGINRTLGLIDRDYVSNRVVVHIPITDCLKKRVSDGKLTVALNNYDNNRYIQTIPVTDKSSLRVVFDDITMSGKDPEKETFQLILNNSLTVPCTYKEFYPQYDLLLQGVDCSGDFHPSAPHYDAPSHPDALIQ
ncbi:MAG: hypothetical protein BGO55_03705 [Sphingobacteriales bacterium 50-39]|nr:hypothetical protein [Sphingobacteriales bacterium]OJW55655.1 MAG: hypothetical protein BGO55_03705 [Sphingobacteriales bacterium 50-39]